MGLPVKTRSRCGPRPYNGQTAAAVGNVVATTADQDVVAGVASKSSVVVGPAVIDDPVRALGLSLSPLVVVDFGFGPFGSRFLLLIDSVLGSP